PRFSRDATSSPKFRGGLLLRQIAASPSPPPLPSSPLLSLTGGGAQRRDPRSPTRPWQRGAHGRICSSSGAVQTRGGMAEVAQRAARARAPARSSPAGLLHSFPFPGLLPFPSLPRAALDLASAEAEPGGGCSIWPAVADPWLLPLPARRRLTFRVLYLIPRVTIDGDCHGQRGVFGCGQGTVSPDGQLAQGLGIELLSVKAILEPAMGKEILTYLLKVLEHT
ncbi:unnamed protein product, partial [Urochloa humidicola]